MFHLTDYFRFEAVEFLGVQDRNHSQESIIYLGPTLGCFITGHHWHMILFLDFESYLGSL